jgi:hypothetical protein
MNARQQGDLGEVSAQHWLVRQGYCVFTPIGHSPDVDLIALRGETLLRVQVKTCGSRQNDRWTVAVCTRGGNQSWSGLVKRFSPTRCDYLFALVADGRQWFIPATEIGERNVVLLGGPKYARFEVDRGYSFSRLDVA